MKSNCSTVKKNKESVCTVYDTQAEQFFDNLLALISGVMNITKTLEKDYLKVVKSRRTCSDLCRKLPIQE